MSALSFCEFACGPFLTRKIAEGVKTSTLVQYRDAFKHWGAFEETNFTDRGCLLPSEITKEMGFLFVARLRQHVTPKRGEKVSSWTIRKHVKSLQSVLNYWGELYGEKVVRLPKPRGEVSLRVCWSIEEINDLLKACDRMTTPKGAFSPSMYWRNLIKFVFYSGMRIGDVLELELEAIWKNVIEFRTRKTGAIHRLTLTDELRKVVDNMIEMDFGESSIPYLFPWPHDRRYLFRQCVLLCERAGFPSHRRTGFHSLRRSHVTELSRISSLAAQASVGHASSDTTVRFYLAQDAVRSALAKMPRIGC